MVGDLGRIVARCWSAAAMPLDPGPPVAITRTPRSPLAPRCSAKVTSQISDSGVKWSAGTAEGDALELAASGHGCCASTVPTASSGDALLPRPRAAAGEQHGSGEGARERPVGRRPAGWMR